MEAGDSLDAFEPVPKAPVPKEPVQKEAAKPAKPAAPAATAASAAPSKSSVPKDDGARRRVQTMEDSDEDIEMGDVVPAPRPPPAAAEKRPLLPTASKEPVKPIAAKEKPKPDSNEPDPAAKPARDARKVATATKKKYVDSGKPCESFIV